MTDFVYFLRPRGSNGPVKIGCSKAPKSRVAVLEANLPWRLEIAASLPGSYDLERRFHARFLDQHTRREWFDWSPELEETIEAVRTGVFDTSALPAPVSLSGRRGCNRRPLPPYLTHTDDIGLVTYTKLCVVPLPASKGVGNAAS